MVDIKYANAYTEVIEILKYVSIEDYNKIPRSKIELFKINANREYAFKYNSNRTLDEQSVSKIAKSIIAILFRDYWTTDIQRERIITKQNYDRKKFEEENREKYNLDNLFKNRQYKVEAVENSVAMVAYKESIFIKIKNRFKRIFK